MLDSIKNFILGDSGNSNENNLESSQEKVALATCALLLEMAYADDEFTDDEKEKMLKILSDNFEITEQEAFDLMQQAEGEREKNIDLWQFTHKINEDYSKEEKLQVARNLWQVIYSDRKVDKHEEYLMRKLTSLLNLSHGDMIEAKIDVEKQK